MKANFLWPGMNHLSSLLFLLDAKSILAQWSSAFGVDDTQNQPLADWFGIVMGTRYVSFSFFKATCTEAQGIH